MEGFNTISGPKIFTLDLEDGYDTVAKIEIFLEWLKKQSFYRPDLLYCGLDIKDIGKNSSEIEPGYIFCLPEKYFLEDPEGNGGNGAYSYASEKENPAIAVYNPHQLEQKTFDCYKLKDPSGLLAVIKLENL